MGQNNHKQLDHNYKNNDFIKQQIQYYRWRADPFINHHISKVFFHFQQLADDQEKFNNLIESKFYANQDMSINEIMNLTKNSHPLSKEQFMTFETYICQVSDMMQKLTVQEILYVMQVMLNGYEIIFNKMGKCKVELECCFVTMVEGQVKIWINQNYKSNQIQQNHAAQRSNCILTEVSIIKKILEVIERLASNPTELLHFTRQLRQFMERNILQHWNFIQVRKFINNYAYTYKINLPLNLMAAIKRKSAYSFTTSEKQFTSRVSLEANSKVIQPQTKQVPCEQILLQKGSMINSVLLRQENMRPMHQSDQMHKKSTARERAPFCYHSKKFTSTDVKYMSERAKGLQSPKMNKSQILYKKNEQFSHNKSFHLQHQNPINTVHNVNTAANVSNIKYRKVRQLAIMGDSNDFKICDFSTNIGLSPNSFSTPIEIQRGQVFDAMRKSSKALTNNFVKAENIPKEKQKEKKKLEKKVALNKYINYYKNESTISITIPQAKQSNNSNIQQHILSGNNNFQNIPSIHLKQHSDSKIQIISHDSVKMSSSKENALQSKNSSLIRHEQISHYKNNSLDNHSASNIIDTIEKGRSEYLYVNNNLANITINEHLFKNGSKTVNKLVGNQQVSEIESQGSFLSMEEGNRSDYNGILLKMGRSVDFLNINSSKKMTMNSKKSINSGTVHYGKLLND